MYDIIVIGAGPAGMTAAIYARRAMKKVLVLEGLSYGGQIINTLSIENYPGMPYVSGADFATSIFSQAKELGTEFVFEEALKIKDGKTKKVITEKNTYEGKTIIIATGCKDRELRIPNEKEFVGKGVSYCATCDGNFYKGKEVAVAGGGNSALDDALYLSDIASKVYLIHRGDKFNGEEAILDILKEKGNVEFILKTNITKIIGNKKVEKIELNNKKEIEVKGLFIAIGKVPSNEKFKNLIEVNDKGYITARENCHTNVPGIFAAGDTRVKRLRQLVTATSDGAIAATEAIKYINKEKRNVQSK